MSKTRRVVFTFDERSLESLQQIKDQGRFGSLADVVRESLGISRALQLQNQQGFTEIIVRNPETKQERVLVIPPLQPRATREIIERNPDTKEHRAPVIHSLPAEAT